MSKEIPKSDWNPEQYGKGSYYLTPTKRKNLRMLEFQHGRLVRKEKPSCYVMSKPYNMFIQALDRRNYLVAVKSCAIPKSEVFMTEVLSLLALFNIWSFQIMRSVTVTVSFKLSSVSIGSVVVKQTQIYLTVTFKSYCLRTLEDGCSLKTSARS